MSKKAKTGFRGYPVGTIAFYGPNDKRASKVVVAILTAEDAEPDELRKWTSETGDVRRSEEIGEEMAEYLQAHHVRSVAMMEAIFGCPHEEGIDYPLGETCPHCPFWANRDRFTGKLIN